MKIKLIKIFFLLVTFCVLPSSASATLEVNNVSGTIADGQNITISGAAFGSSGPSTEIFDDFEGGVAGDIVPLTSPKVGTWTGYNSLVPNQPKYDSTAHSGAGSFRSFDGNTHYTLSMIKTFDPATEGFVSFWVKLPAGTYFPGNTGDTAGSYPTNSAWKMTWFMDTPIGGGVANDDWTVPTWIGSGPAISGNDQPATFWLDNDWWSFSNWVRVSYWMKAGVNQIVDNGNIWFQGLNEGVIQKTYTKNDIPLFNTISRGTSKDTDYHWRQLNIPGWMDTSYSGPNVRPVYDDIYVATGANAQARVEIGNAATYAASTNLTISTVNSWSDAAVNATIRQGSFTDGQSAYVYVFDKDGNVNASGFPVTFGSAVGDVIAPSAPAGLSVL
ncbi:MAG: hypothetical protein HGA36_02860 [Candidatus Moranbacteria bacterium]|nr:hypothetical protein [Candidatus Moranbacteria bacterium]